MEVRVTHSPPVCVIGTLNNETLTSAMQLLWRCQVASHLLLSQLSWREAMLSRYLAKKPSVRPRMGVSCVAPVEWCKLCGPRGAMPQAFFCNPDARLCHDFQFQKDPFFENKKILKF
jgi:hypothetical protein